MTDRTPQSAHEAELRLIEQQAAEWFGRCELGLSPEQEREFLRWLERDERHGEAMRDMDETWSFLDGLKEIRPPCATTRATPRRNAWRTSLWLAVAASIAVAAFVSWRTGEPAAMSRQIATAAGGMKNIDLPDGSIVHLNADSHVEFRFTRTMRDVRLLRGEAHFAVAKDPARPFVVQAGDIAVKAIGTAFNVRREGRSVEVLVTEGRVRIDHATKGESLLPPPAKAASDLLVAGQRAVVALSTDPAAPQPAVVAAIAPDDIEHALAWRARQLEFDLTPLAEVVAEFNRYNSHQLVIDDPELARQQFGGSFRADNYHVFVRLLEQRFGVITERDDEVTTLRRAK